MPSRAAKNAATVGVSDHAGWAVLITVDRDAKLVDRRRVELVDAALPSMPHHHDAQPLPRDEGVALVEHVRRSADVYSKACLRTLVAAVPLRITGIALRVCPPLPPTVAERITNYRAQCVADWVMYRQALASAAEARGWAVHWYEAKSVLDEAGETLGRKSLEALLKQTGAALGPPWQKDHRVAMAAAIAAARRGER